MSKSSKKNRKSRKASQKVEKISPKENVELSPKENVELSPKENVELSPKENVELSDLPKDIANLLIKDLKLEDLQNLYHAGGNTKAFMEKNFLKDGYLMKYKVKKENIRKYNDLLKLCEGTASLNCEKNCIYIFTNINPGKNVEICLKKDFFEEYFCFRSFQIPRIYTCNIIDEKACEMSIYGPANDEACEIGVLIEDIGSVKIITQRLGWNFSTSISYHTSSKDTRHMYPDFGLINIPFDQKMMKFVFELMESYDITSFIVSNNTLKIGKNKSIDKTLPESVKDFSLELKTKNLHLFSYIFDNIIFRLSDSFLLLQHIKSTYDFKLLFTPSIIQPSRY